MCDYYGVLFHRAYETQDQNSIRNGTESHATTQLHPCEGEAELVHSFQLHNSTIYQELVKLATELVTLQKPHVNGITEYALSY